VRLESDWLAAHRRTTPPDERVRQPGGYVQTLKPGSALYSSFDPATAQPFGSKPQFAYLQVVGPEVGSRLLVLNPATKNCPYVNASDVGQLGRPPG